MEVSSTEFQTRAGRYIEQSAKEPVYITRHRRPVRVLLDVEEYKRLQKLAKHRPTREAYFVEDLPGEVIAALESAVYGPVDSEIEKLMDRQGEEA